MTYKVTFYTNRNSKSPIEQFLIKSEKSLQIKISRQIEYLKLFGLTKANPSLKKLTGTPLWEIRILGKDSTRIICVGIVSNEIVILNIFKKRSSKTPLRELDIALKRYLEVDK